MNRDILKFMSNSIGSLLTQREFFEPPEIALIKQYVFEHYQVTPAVSIQNTEIIIGIGSSSLAGALRPQLGHIKQLCKTDKRLVLRIQ
jgi:hypothetical protein